MPAFNASLFLRSCIDSIINQTYENWELIVVDDFSTDRTYQILYEYSLADQRIRVFRNDSKGIIPALNLGYHKSSGYWITRMDADDIMDHHKFYMMVKGLSQGNDKETKRKRIAVGMVEYFSDSELGQGYKKYAGWLNDLTATESNFSEIYKECTIPSACWMTDRASFISCGGFASDIYPEDYDLAFRFRENDLQIVGINKVLHYWRDHQDRASRTLEVYRDNDFAPIKVYYFIRNDFDPTKPLVLIGAGKKGKKVAKELSSQNITFMWLTNNPNKIGVSIYDVNLENQSKLLLITKAQVIVAISSPKDIVKMRNMTDNLAVRHQYFWFY